MIFQKKKFKTGSDKQDLRSIQPSDNRMQVATQWMAKLMKLSNVEETNLLMYPRGRLLLEMQRQQLVRTQQKQIWGQLENLLNQLQQPKVRPGYQLKNQVLSLYLLKKLEALLLFRSPHNLQLLHRKVVGKLQLQQRGKEEIKLYKNNLRIIKFLAQVQLAVKKGHQFNNRNHQKLGLLNCRNQVLQLLELVKLSLQLKNLLLRLVYNPRKVFYPQKLQEELVNCKWQMRLQVILQEASIVLRLMIIHQRVRI